MPDLHQDELLVRHLRTFFSDLDSDAIGELHNALEWVEIAGGGTLMTQGEPGDSMFVVISGRLRAYVADEDGSPHRVREMGRGQIIGEMSLYTGASRSATVVAIRDSVLARLAKADFDRLLADAARPPVLHETENRHLVQRPGRSEAAEILVLLHPPQVRCPRGTREWFARRPVADHVHVRPDVDRDMARLARLQTHTADLGPDLGHHARVIKRASALSTVRPVRRTLCPFTDVGARYPQDATDRLHLSSPGNKGERAIHFRSRATSMASFRTSFSRVLRPNRRSSSRIFRAAAASSEAGTTGSPAATEARLPPW
jgi:CRP-like cAMP-binding protein